MLRVFEKPLLVVLSVLLLPLIAACGSDEPAAAPTVAPTVMPTAAPAATPSIRVVDSWARPAAMVSLDATGDDSAMGGMALDAMGDDSAMGDMALDAMEDDSAMGGMASDAMEDDSAMGGMASDAMKDDSAMGGMASDAMKDDSAMGDMASDAMKDDSAIGGMATDAMEDDSAMGGMGGTGAIYFSLFNDGDAADSLISISDVHIDTPGDTAGAAEMHESSMDAEGVMSMEQVQSIAIPAGGSVELKPGGFHVMLLDLKRDLVPGDAISLTLDFQTSPDQTIEAVVREP